MNLFAHEQKEEEEEEDRRVFTYGLHSLIFSRTTHLFDNGRVSYV